jgi:hypothetical protein
MKTLKEIEELYLQLIKLDTRIKELEVKNSELENIIKGK